MTSLHLITFSYKIPVLWNFTRQNKACKLLTDKKARDGGEPPQADYSLNEQKSFTAVLLRNAFVCSVCISKIKVDLDFKFLKFQYYGILPDKTRLISY